MDHFKELLGNQLDLIADRTIKQLPSFSSIGLLSGQSGCHLFLFYYAYLKQDEYYYDKAIEGLQHIFEYLASGFKYYSWSEGLAGILWSIDHLKKVDMLEVDSSLLNSYNDYLRSEMLRLSEEGNFDFLHGSTGIGWYLIQKDNIRGNSEVFQKFLAQVEKWAIEEEDGSIKWDFIIGKDKTRAINISLSHGMIGLLSLLIHLYKAGLTTSEKFILGGIAYVLKQEYEKKEVFISRYPYYSKEAEIRKPGSRLAWCYGDLGVSIFLWNAAQAFNRADWRAKSLEILRLCASRRDLKKNLVFDACICHGATGNGMIFNRFFKRTGEQLFHDTALYWYEKALQFGSLPEDDFLGYRNWKGENKGGWTKDINLLDGLSGIGLGMISFIKPEYNNWQNCLLI